jgi:Endonuclease NucS
MSTEIRTWQILNGKLTLLDSTLKDEKRTEPYDLEPWLRSQPEIIGADLLLIGQQVTTKSGFIDLLAIDRSGSTVIIELKRDELPRECLAQAIDYASDVASWTVERLSEVCSEYRKTPLETAFNEAFPEVDAETLNINSSQRIILVGFAVESSLERMIEWLSEAYGVQINAVVLHYVKTKSGDELLTRTSVISEDVELERGRKQRTFEVPMSDTPGAYEPEELRRLLYNYLRRPQVTSQRLRDILFPALLREKVVTRAELKKAFTEFDPNYDESKIGNYLSLVSQQLGREKNDFLRQVITYEYPRHDWEKDNFSIPEQYRPIVEGVLQELRGSPVGASTS